MSVTSTSRHALLTRLAAVHHLHCAPPAERGPLIGVAPFQLYFELRNGYKCRVVGDAAANTWKAEVCCGHDGVFDALEREEAMFDIVRFMTTMSMEESWPFGALYGVSKCGTRNDGEPQPDAAFETKMLNKIAVAAETLS
jgi:hypothetical protein